MNDQFNPDEITTKPSPKFSWVHMLIILLVAIIAGGGVWAYYQYVVVPDLEKKAETVTVTPTKEKEATDETADWETYTNSTHGYSIKYPKDWTLGDEGANGDANRLSWIELTNPSQFDEAIVVFEVLKNTYSSISDWADKMNEGDGMVEPGTEKMYEVKSATVDGIAGKQLSTLVEGYIIRTGAIKSNKLYIIHLICPADQKNKDELTAIYNKMITTFKLTK